MTENVLFSLAGGGPSLPDTDHQDLHGASMEGVSVVDGGSTAVLQGLMTMLGEVLSRLDSRLAMLEDNLANQPGILELQTTTLSALEQFHARLDQLEASSTSDREAKTAIAGGLQTLGQRLAQLEAATAARDGEARTAVVAGLDGVVERLDRLEAATAARDGEARTAVVAGLDGVVERLDRLEAATAARDGEARTAVVAGLDALVERLDRLEATGVPAASVEAAVSRLEELAGAVDTIGYGLAGLVEVVTSNQRQNQVEGLQAKLEALGNEVGELRRSLLDHPVEVQHALGRLDLEVQALRAQPGPGPALAMVAAGLAERFEERTQAVTDLLDANAEFSRRLWERIEELLDGGGFDDLAVGEALEHLIDELESLTAVVHQALPAGGGPPPGLEPVQTTLTMLVRAVERLRNELEDLRGRHAALSASIDSLRQEGEVPAHTGPGGLGRRATEAGRRLASDLGLRSREHE